ncbi:hypothetical protein D3C75_1040980 [compost metagenome]
MDARLRLAPNGAMRPNTAQNGRRSPRITGTDGLLRISSSAASASSDSAIPRLEKPSCPTITTPNGAPMAIAP